MEIIKEMLLALVTAAVPILTVYLCKFLYAKWNESKERVTNEKVKNTLDQVLSMVFDCVQSTNQVFVDELKNKNKFSKEAAIEAFNMSKNAAIKMLSAEAKEIIATIYGDIDSYIDVLIESAVKQLKK